MSPKRGREGIPSKQIYYISLFSNLSRQGEGGGVMNSGKWADVVYGWPLSKIAGIFSTAILGLNPPTQQPKYEIYLIIYITWDK